jgi:hypothetical protein
MARRRGAVGAGFDGCQVIAVAHHRSASFAVVNQRI